MSNFERIHLELLELKLILWKIIVNKRYLSLVSSIIFLNSFCAIVNDKTSMITDYLFIMFLINILSSTYSLCSDNRPQDTLSCFKTVHSSIVALLS
jgi:hypothetical protein